MRRFELASGREVELLADVLGEPTVKVRDVQTKQEFSMWRKDVPAEKPKGPAQTPSKKVPPATSAPLMPHAPATTVTESIAASLAEKSK